jgi:hypothetical protein
VGLIGEIRNTFPHLIKCALAYEIVVGVTKIPAVYRPKKQFAIENLNLKYQENLSPKKPYFQAVVIAPL